MLHYFFYITLLFTPIFAYAQTHVYGRIINPQKQPIDAVSIICVQQKDSIKSCESFSNSKGEFDFTVNKQMNYILRLSCVGYKPQIIRLTAQGKKLNLGNIEMEASSIMLKEIAINANPIIHKTDRTLLFPTKEQIKHAFNGYNVLYNIMLSDLDIDPFSKEIKRYNIKAILCINGREVESREIELLDPKAILRIDYYDIHPKYPQQPVIDFILVNREYGGNVISDNKQALTRIDGKYNIATQLFHKKHEFSLGITDSYANYKQDQTNQTNYTFLLEDGTLLNSQAKIISLKNKDNTLNSYIGYLYKGKKTLFSANTWLNTQRPITSIDSKHTYDRDTYPNLMGREHTKSKNLAPGGKLYFSQAFKNQNKLEAIMIYNYANNTYKRNNNSWENEKLYHQSNTHIKERFYYYKPSLNYTHNFKNNYSLWMSFKHLTQVANSTHYYANGKSENEKNKSTQTTYEFTLTKQWKKWLALLNWRQGGEVSKQKQTNKQYTYEGKWVIRYVPNQKNSFSFAFLAAKRPLEFKWKTNIEQEIDFMQIKKGNPNLKDIKGCAAVLNYSLTMPWGNLSAHIEGQCVTQALSIYTYREAGKFIHTYYAGGRGQFMVSEIKSSIKLIPRILTLKTSIGYRQAWVDSCKKDNITTWLYGANLLFTHKNWIASANIHSHHREDEIMLQDNLQGSSYNFNIGYSSNKLNVTLGCRNPFSHYKTYRSFSSDVYKENMISYNSDRMAYLTLSYRFHFGNKKHKFNKLETEIINNSAILKAND